MQKSLTQKIIALISIIAGALLLLISVRFLSQNLYAVYELNIKITKTKWMVAKLAVMCGFTVVSFILTLVYHLIKLPKNKLYHYKRLAIANSVIIGISILLVIIFMNTEAHVLAKEFLYDQTKPESVRSLGYYFYNHRKYVQSVVLATIMILGHWGLLVKTAKEKIIQSLLYTLSIILVFLNSMFLMVTMLDGLKSSDDISGVFITIPTVVLSTLVFFLAFFHLFVGIIQRRAISDDKLNHHKIKIASFTFIAFEGVLTLATIILLNIIFSTVKSYLIVLFTEYAQLLLLLTLLSLGALKYSVDERLVTERKERLLAQSELDNSETLKV